MKLFLAASYEDASYLPQFAALVRNKNATSVKFKTESPSMFSEFVQWCKHYEADAVVITNQSVLELVLHSQVDFRPPNTRKGITLDDYQGSLLTVRVGERSIPAVVINPLQHLVTVPYGKFLAERWLSKILQPENWLPDVPFVWKLAEINNAEAITNRLSTARLIAVDIETPTDGPKADARFINCVGYAGLYGEGGSATIECYVFPFDEWSYDYIKRINDNQVAKVFQNGLYDNVYFMRWGVPVRNWLWDTYHFFHSWLSELPKDLGLVAAFSVRRIRYWKDDGKSGSLEDYYRYNAQDCWATLLGILGLLRDAPEWAITNYSQHEFKLVFPCITCELEGIAVDLERFKEVFDRKWIEKQKELIEIQTMLGGPCDPFPLETKSDGSHKIKYFNPNSPQQVRKVFELLGCGSLGSTDKAATLKARAAHPLNDVVIGAITSWKTNAKLISNYLQEHKIFYGRILYKLDPGGTDTGRMASKASSFWCGIQIQNIPRDDTLKQCLIADNGWLLGEGDYAQSEARCVGYLSGETKLIDVVEGPNDYHAWNASQFFGTPYEAIYRNATPELPSKTLDKPLRDLSKRTNHGANYNMGEGVMLDTMGPKYVAEAKRLLKLPAKLPLRMVCRYLLQVYEKTYPRVKKDWYGSITKDITISGMLVSSLGWTRKFFGKPAENKQHLNAAVAHGPQNLSVGIINGCFFDIWKQQFYGDLKGRFRIKAQIHDSILFQYRTECPEVPGIVRDRMRRSILVTDCFGVERTMVIPPDMCAGTKRWSELK